MKMTVVSTCVALATLRCIAAAQAAERDQQAPDSINSAVAVILPTKASQSTVAGVVRLKQENGYVRITGQVTGLTPGKHGFHIHEYGDTSAPDGTSAGGHYNPQGHPHGGPGSKTRHEGDLGNIEADSSGAARIDTRASHVDLHHILGRSIVVHGDADDLTSQPSGNAGPRVGIGVIGLAATPTGTAAK